MQPKVILTPLAQYKPVDWNGVNESGILPVGDRVLILPDEPADESTGGVAFTQQQVEHNRLAAETGVLVAVGESAWFWNSDRTRRFEGVKPEPGQRLWFERYAGAIQHGDDGRIYRIMDDKCVGGVRVNSKPVKGTKLRIA